MFKHTRKHAATALVFLAASVSLVMLGAPAGAGAAAVAFAKPPVPVTDPAHKLRYGLGGLLPRKQVNPRIPKRGLADTLPASVDLTANDVPVAYQGSVGSCVTWAIDYALVGWYENRDHRQVQFLNPMYTFSQIRVVSADGKEGSYPGDALDHLQREGNDTMAHYSHNEFDKFSRPSPAEIANAANYKVVGAATVFSSTTGTGFGQPGADAIKRALFNGQPVAIGLWARPGLKRLDATTSYIDSDTTGTPDGGHEVLAVGYNQNGLQIQNSWGTSWGQNGYGWLSWSVVGSDVYSAHTITDLAANADPDSVGVNVALGQGAGTTQPATFSWPATDAAGIASYIVDLKTDGAWTMLSSTGTANQTTLSLSVGHGYQLAVAAKDAAGNLTGFWYSAVVTPSAADTTAPTVTAPVQTVPTGVQLGTTAVPVKLSWTASDSGSGLARFIVWQSTNGAGFVQADTVSASTTTDTLMLEPSNTYRFVVRALDVAGNSADAYGGSFRLDAYQETSGGVTNTGVTYTGTWSSVPWALAYGGYEKSASQAAASASFSFIGKTVSVVAPVFASAGSATVFADNVKVADISFAGSPLTAADVVYTYAFPAGGVHTLRLVTDSAARVDVDAFVTLG